MPCGASSTAVRCNGQGAVDTGETLGFETAWSVEFIGPVLTESVQSFRSGCSASCYGYLTSTFVNPMAWRSWRAFALDLRKRPGQQHEVKDLTVTRLQGQGVRLLVGDGPTHGLLLYLLTHW